MNSSNHMDNAIPNWARACSAAMELLLICDIYKPPIDILDIARKLGLMVKSVPSLEVDGEPVSGYYIFKDKVIYVNRQDSDERIRFTIAHEIGHSILHADYMKKENGEVLYRNTAKKIRDPKEREADHFAANLLVPSFLLRKHVKYAAIEDLSKIFMVSQACIGFRLANEGLY